MATISTRINSSGTFLVNGSFDEITYNRTSPVIKNLLIYTEDFSGWSNSGGNIVTTNQSIAPDGSLTADRIQATTGDYTAILNNSSVGGASYTFSFWVKSVSGATGTWGVNYFNGAHNRTTVPITGEWSRQYITFIGTGGQFNIYIADNRSSLATITDAYVWGAQLERGTTPTIYQGITASGTLITPTFINKATTNTYYVTNVFNEVTYNSTSPAIKNLVQYTEQLDNAYWILTNGLLPVTANAIVAPNNTLTADKVTENTTASTNHYFQSTSVLISSNTQYTWSIYAKAGERTFIDLALGTASFWVNSARSATFNLTTGVVTNVSASPLVASITPAGNGWYRCSITATSAGTSGMSSNGQVRLCDGTGNNIYNGDGVSGAYFWGAQLEQNSTATIYQGIAAANTLVAPGFAKRETSDGSLYVTGKFDEVRGMIVTDGLLLQLDPGKPESFITSGSSLTDISGNTRNCTLIGAITYDSTSSSLLFDTTATTVNNRISLLSSTGIDNTISFTDGSEYTIECWCKIASDAIATYHSIAGRGTTNPWLGIQKNASSYNLFFRQGLTYFYSTTINASVFTGWTQVVFSVDANRVVRYYVNHAAGTFTDSDNVTTSTFTINRLAAGYTSGGNYYAFDGNIGPINVYNKALSAAEVNNNFEALRDRFGI